MPFQRRSQIPFKGPDVVAFNPEAERVHHPDQLFGFGVSRAGENVEHLQRLGVFVCLKMVARFFHGLGVQRRAKQTQQCTGCVQLVYAVCCHIFALLALPAAAQISPDDYIAADPMQARIGQLLFYDKILSGNQNISCGTCHHHDFHGTDGLSLGIGEGGVGLGPERTPGVGADRIKKRIPRNAPALWNLGHKDIRVLFHDGRLTHSNRYDNGFDSPAEEWLPEGLDNLLAAQALFPMTAQFEMAGNPGENEVTGAVHERIDYGWPIIAKRVRTIPEYGNMFVQAFDHITKPEDVTIVEIGNALGAFIASEWQSFDSPYDAWLAGTPLPSDADRGRELFFSKGLCAGCHSGPLFSDQSFHALGLPAFGPGRTRRWDPIPRDVGRMGETDRLEDAYRFRTPSLRNVALTAPYGHNGAYPTLEDMIRHHTAPQESRVAYNTNQANLPEVPWLAKVDFAIQQDTREMARLDAATSIQEFELSENEINDLVAFLNALTGETFDQRPLGRPDRVPSGLAVD